MRIRTSRSISTPDLRSSLRSVSLSISSSSYRTEEMNGITYLVFPVISKVGDNVEWSINAPYPELVPSSVLSLATESRNGRPVVMDHPYEDGEYVSANNPEILEKYCFGYFFNAYFDESDNKVKGEMWLDEARANEVGEEAVNCIERLKDGEIVEVSEGNFVLIEEEQGIANGRDYKAKWVLAIPDHLAVLPSDTKGACSIADGCGGNRLSSGGKKMRIPTAKPKDRDKALEVNQANLSVSMMNQARKPKYSGTESSTWEKPTFADYVKYLYNGDSPPSSVGECTAEMKREIADHTLAGDPEASSFSELSKFPVVSPSTGKLNENALRSVMSGKGMMGDMDEKLKSSCQDMARRLLNSEFSANLESMKKKDMKTKEKDMDDMEDDPMMKDAGEGMTRESKGMFQRIVNSVNAMFKASMSNNLLREKLEHAIRKSDAAFWWLEDYDTDKKTVVYTTRMVLGMEYDGTVEMHCWRRTYNVDANGNITVNDDKIKVHFVGTYEPMTESEDGMDDMDDPNMKASSGKDKEPCKCKGETMSVSEKKKGLITKLLSRCDAAAGKVKQEDLEKVDEATLELMLTMSEAKEGETTKETKEAVTTPASTPDPDSVTVSKTEYAAIKAAADEHNKELDKKKADLVASLKASQEAYSEDELKAMDIPQLEKVGKLVKTTTPKFDYSGARGFGGGDTSTPSVSHDSWGLNKGEEKAN